MFIFSKPYLFIVDDPVPLSGKYLKNLILVIVFIWTNRILCIVFFFFFFKSSSWVLPPPPNPGIVYNLLLTKEVSSRVKSAVTFQT